MEVLQITYVPQFTMELLPHGPCSKKLNYVWECLEEGKGVINNIKKLKILTIFDIVTYIQCIQYIEAASQLIVCILEMYLVYITAPPSTSSLTTQRFLWTNACLILFI